MALLTRGGDMDTDRRYLRSGPIELDLERWQAVVPGREVPLSALQFRLLAHLMRRPGCVFTRPVLLEALWGIGAHDRERSAVDVLVCRLRQQLGDAGEVIETV